MNDLFNKVPIDKIPRVDRISPEFFCKQFAAFLTLAVAQAAPLAEGVENGFWWLGKVVIMVVLGVVVLVVSCEGEDNFWAQGGVCADVIGAEFTAVTEGGEVAGESVDECLLSGNGVGMVDEENRH